MKIWMKDPAPEMLKKLEPWLQVHQFPTLRTMVAEGAEGDPQFFRERVVLFLDILSLLKPFCPEGSLFEFGCASGLHCFEAAAEGWSCTGMEPRDIHIRQFQFLCTLLIDGIKRPEIRQGSDQRLFQFGETWDIGVAYSVLQYVPDPLATLRWMARRVNSALILETPVYMPPREEAFFSPGANWTYTAPCQLSNHGAQAHNKKGIEPCGLIPSFPALVYLIFCAGFTHIAHVPPPDHWRASPVRGLRQRTRFHHLLIAFKDPAIQVSLNMPAGWNWLNRPPNPPNFDYRGPLPSGKAPRSQKQTSRRIRSSLAGRLRNLAETIQRS